MATYKVLEKSYINDRVIEVGETVDYDGEASGNLELISKKKSAKDNTAEAAVIDDLVIQ